MKLARFQSHRTSVLVTLLDGTNVPTEFFGLSKGDAYLVISLHGGDNVDKESYHRFKTIGDTTDPVWNERAWLACLGPCTSLSVYVYDDNGPLCRDAILGKTTLLLMDGEQTITIPGGNGSYRLSQKVLKDHQTTLTDRNSLSMRTCDKGTYVLETLLWPYHQSVVL